MRPALRMYARGRSKPAAHRDACVRVGATIELDRRSPQPERACVHTYLRATTTSTSTNIALALALAQARGRARIQEPEGELTFGRVDRPYVCTYNYCTLTYYVYRLTTEP